MIFVKEFCSSLLFFEFVYEGRKPKPTDLSPGSFRTFFGLNSKKKACSINQPGLL